ncbi:MAG: DNA mismatch repair endonuclease MutL [Defluviitaleaceae bacterium]|nr:DNA mismatch repair endonuclease MutL [Defluviitaleaceae bacterium]
MIVQLDRSLINKIAAGEVVERPLSVVKELTENAIDAGASVITVEIRDGGLTSVRVTDNGGGIPAEDLPLAFARHATSKISNFDDLMQVQTLGFRGEALSSIAAVAQVEMITKTYGTVSGTRMVVHGGKLISSKETGCADGTTVIVSNLFYNTPARRKFLKKPATEAGCIAHCLERLALGNPSLVLRYINNGQIVFQTTGNGDLKTAMLKIYAREIAAKTVSVDASVKTGVDPQTGEVTEMRLHGLAGKPETARGNRRHGSFFINARYIESKLVTRAIESAMKTMLPSGKFPVYALNLSIPPENIDVNVHPTKMDVRFADEDGVFEFIENAVRDALEEHNLIPRVRLGGRAGDILPEPEQIPLPYQRQPVKSELKVSKLSLREENFTASSFSQPVSQPVTQPVARPVTQPIAHPPVHPVAQQSEPPRKFFSHYKIHCLLFQTYWLVSQKESLFLIDQHAAHERVLYENFLRKAKEETILAQNLLVPVTLRLTPRERQILDDNRDVFEKFGFKISGDIENPEIEAVPFLMKGPLPTGFFTDLLDKMGEPGFEKNNTYTHKTELVAMAACKAAVKAGDAMGEEEARNLVEQMLELDNPFTCPHGRPTIIEITKTELERRFKR